MCVCVCIGVCVPGCVCVVCMCIVCVCNMCVLVCVCVSACVMYVCGACICAFGVGVMRVSGVWYVCIGLVPVCGVYVGWSVCTCVSVVCTDACVCDLRMCVYMRLYVFVVCVRMCLACVHLCGVCVCVRLRCVCTCVYMYLCVLCVHLCSGMYGGGCPRVWCVCVRCAPSRHLRVLVGRRGRAGCWWERRPCCRCCAPRSLELLFPERRPRGAAASAAAHAAQSGQRERS